MKKPKAPKKGVKVTNPLVPGKQHHRHRHQKPGKPHHHAGPGGHRMTNPLVPGPKSVHIAPVHHHHHRPPKKPKKRKLSIGDVSCCSAEALAASLRLQGVPVGDEDVLALYWHTASDPDAGAFISDTLEAAAEYGLAGWRPRHIEVFRPELQYDPALLKSPFILGATLPGGTHALAADAGAWWSWGEPYCPCSFPRAVIEEAWSVRWAPVGQH